MTLEEHEIPHHMLSRVKEAHLARQGPCEANSAVKPRVTILSRTGFERLWQKGALTHSPPFDREQIGLACYAVLGLAARGRRVLVGDSAGLGDQHVVDFAHRMLTALEGQPPGPALFPGMAQ